MGRKTHPWGREAEREADGPAAPNFQRRVEASERGAMLSWGMPFYLRCAAAARTHHASILARGLAIRSGGAGGSASPPRGGPHGGGSMLMLVISIRRVGGSGAECRTPNGGFG